MVRGKTMLDAARFAEFGSTVRRRGTAAFPAEGSKIAPIHIVRKVALGPDVVLIYLHRSDIIVVQVYRGSS